jgi:hypothetical protein
MTSSSASYCDAPTSRATIRHALDDHLRDRRRYLRMVI